jgi:hypothetical protein
MQTGSNLDTSVLERVQEGMRIVDASGADVGKVQYVQMGDPEAVTTAGNDRPRTDLLGAVGEAILPDESEPDVPEPVRSNLRRTGYLKIDGHGLLDTDRYVAPDRVRDIAGDVVRLTVLKDQLAKEH